NLDFAVSSATVRNEMSDLAEMGLLEQPHTSAGRVPSQKGYRVYIDSLMKRKPVTREEKRYLDSLLLSSAYDPEKLLDGVSRALAATTRFAAISTTPSGRSADIRAVQFVQTSRRTAMVILMTSAGTMKTRVFHCDFDLSQEILRVFFRVFNEKLAGLPVSAVTPAFMQTLAASMGEMAILMSSAFMAVLDVARDSMQAEIRMEGQTNLLFYPDLALTARRVMDFLAREDDLNRLLEQRTKTVKVLIGDEIQRPELKDSSVVISRYAIGGRDAGALAIIGPMRMNYAKVIAHMEYLSDSVGKMLTELMDYDF
ncbi:heat-inducible transcriptional repressor HrcA, partial [Blautia wexlerae]|nr:heat-inducible transcriptional repressor HrcA [Blautia wexlerae]